MELDLLCQDPNIIKIFKLLGLAKGQGNSLLRKAQVIGLCKKQSYPYLRGSVEKYKRILRPISYKLDLLGELMPYNFLKINF